MLLTVSEVAAKHLNQWADAVLRGELEIWQLPTAVQQFVTIGWADGIAHAKTQAREYEHRLDMAYLHTVTPKERAAELQRRLTKHFELVDAAFFAADVEHIHDTPLTAAIPHEGIGNSQRAA